MEIAVSAYHLARLEARQRTAAPFKTNVLLSAAPLDGYRIDAKGSKLANTRAAAYAAFDAADTPPRGASRMASGR